MPFISSSPKRLELLKEVLYDSVGQRATQVTILKVWPRIEYKWEFETKILNAKRHGLGSSALQFLC